MYIYIYTMYIYIHKTKVSKAWLVFASTSFTDLAFTKVTLVKR